MEHETMPTQSQDVLKYDKENETGFLGFVEKDNPDESIKVRIDVLVFSDLQDNSVSVYTDKEKAETSKSVLMNSGIYSNLSVVEIETDSETQERRVVE